VEELEIIGIGKVVLCRSGLSHWKTEVPNYFITFDQKKLYVSNICFENVKKHTIQEGFEDWERQLTETSRKEYVQDSQALLRKAERESTPKIAASDRIYALHHGILVLPHNRHGRAATITFERCTFSSPIGAGLTLCLRSGYVTKVNLRDCCFHDSRQGMKIVGCKGNSLDVLGDVRVVSCRFWDCSFGGLSAMVQTLLKSSLRIQSSASVIIGLQSCSA